MTIRPDVTPEELGMAPESGVPSWPAPAPEMAP